jgi:hypothetical protein
MIKDRGRRINVERRTVLVGKGGQFDVLAEKGSVFVGKSVHRVQDLNPQMSAVKRRTHAADLKMAGTVFRTVRRVDGE